MILKFLTLLILLNSFKMTCQTDTLFHYHESGAIRAKTYNVKSKIHEKIFFENGQLKIESVLNNDSVPVELVSYDTLGKITMEIKNKKMTQYDYTYNSVNYYKLKKGKLHGKAKSYVDGKLTYKMKYKNGIPEGKAFGYSEDTKKVIAEEYYEDGKLNGEGRYYTSEHILQRKIFYKNGCPYKAQSYDKLGNIVFETTNKELINIRYRSTAPCP